VSDALPPPAAPRRRAYTTGEAAAICRVSVQSLTAALDGGHLRYWGVPNTRGGVRRRRMIEHADLVRFMRASGIPEPRWE
jgi:hypothetical protein